MNRIRTYLRLLPPKTIGNAAESGDSQGVNFKQCHRKIPNITDDKLEDKLHQLKNGDTFG